MRRLISIITAVALVTTLPLASGCLLEEKVIQIVLNGETCAEFSENHTNENWTDDELVDYGEEILKILEDSGYELTCPDTATTPCIEAAYLRGLEVGVTQFNGDHDWLISGEILVQRTDNPGFVKIVDYQVGSVKGLLGKRQNVTLNANGVALLNGVLDDFINAPDPTAFVQQVQLVFRVQNGNVDPDPSVQDPIVFDWKAWLLIQVVLKETVEVPDPL